LSNKSDATETVAQADLTVSTPAGFGGIATIENDVVVDFGATSIGVVDQIVLQNNASPDQLLLIEEPSGPDLTGEDVELPANSVLYEFGNP
jgi:hypothetical protein